MTNLGWLTFDFAAIYRVYTTNNLTSVKENQGDISRENTGSMSWKAGRPITDRILVFLFSQTVLIFSGVVELKIVSEACFDT